MAERCYYHGAFGQVHSEECERRHSCGVAGMGPLMRASVNPQAAGNMARRNALTRLATERQRRKRAELNAVLGITADTLPDVARMLLEENRMPSEGAALDEARRRRLVQSGGSEGPRGLQIMLCPDGKGEYLVDRRQAAKPARTRLARPVRG